MNVDLELVDKLVSKSEVQTPSKVKHPLVIDYSVLRGSVQSIQGSLEKNNPAEVVEHMDVHGGFVRLPIWGRFGETLGLYRRVNQNVSAEIKKQFEKYMPEILSRLRDACTNVASGSRAINGVVKAFDKAITDLEAERDEAISGYVLAKRGYDTASGLRVQASEQFDAMQTLVASSDHTDVEFDENLKRRDGLEVAIATCEEDLGVCFAEINKQGLRRMITQQNVVRYVDSRKNLKLYLQLAEVYDGFLRDQLREGELTASSIISLSVFMDGLAEASGKMLVFGEYDSSARLAMESLFKTNLLASQTSEEWQAYSPP